jgi:hypothetical protein
MAAGLLLCGRGVKENGRFCGGNGAMFRGRTRNRIRAPVRGTPIGLTGPMAKLIVRRGMRPEYYGFLSVTAVANGDELIVDRRRGMRALSEEGPEEAER